MTQIGYYRVTPSASPDCRARELLKEHGCTTIQYDRCFPGSVLRTGLDAALSSLHEGDILVVPNLHALAGSVVDLFAVLDRLHALKAHLISLLEAVDTRVAFDFMAMSQLFKTFNEQRFVVAAGERLLEKRRVGAPYKIDEQKWAQVAPRLKRDADNRLTLEGAAAALGVNRSTVVRRIQATKD